MKHIKVTQIEVASGMEFNFASYPADGMYLIQNGATLIARSAGLAFMVPGGAFMVSEMTEAQAKSTVTESMFLKALAIMRDAELVNKFDL